MIISSMSPWKQTSRLSGFSDSSSKNQLKAFHALRILRNLAGYFYALHWNRSLARQLLPVSLIESSLNLAAGLNNAVNQGIKTMLH